MKCKKIIPLLFTAVVMCGCGEQVTSSPSTSSVNNITTSVSTATSVGKNNTIELKVKSFDVKEVLGVNKNILIPEYSATDSAGNDLTDLVEITDSLSSNINLSRGIITLLEPGVHKIVFKVVDPSDSTNIASKEFEITCYRELLNFDNMHSEKEEKTSIENQYIVSHNPDKGIARLNMESGKMYYAEAYFDGTTALDVYKGLSHVVSVDNDEGRPNNIWLTSAINVHTKEHSIINSRNYSWIEQTKKSLTSYSLNSTDISNGFKFAIARYGNTLYSFFNDQLIETYTHDVLKDINTTPALYTYMGKAYESVEVESENGGTETVNKNIFAEKGVKISNIDFYNDVRAFEKLKELNVQSLSDTLFEMNKSRISVEEGGSVSLPIITAYKKGKNLLDTLKIYDADKKELDYKSKYYGENKGRYVYTVEVYDEEEKVSLKKELTIIVTDVIFASKNTNYLSIDVQEDDSLTIIQDGHNSKSNNYEGDVEEYQHYAIGALNLSPSKLYYAETTIDTHKTFSSGNTWNEDGNTLFGMAHVQSLALGREKGNNFITSSVRGASRALVMNKFIDNNKKDVSSDDSALTHIQDYISTLKWNSTEFKIAIARNGGLLYTFINDEYIASFYDAEYANIDTLPGVFSTSFNSSLIVTKFRNVSFCDGNDAKTKIDSLLVNNKNMIKPVYSQTRDNSSKWSINDVNETRGVNFDILTSDIAHNQSTFGNFVRFTGDFEIEWDFLPLEANANSAEQGESSFMLKSKSDTGGKLITSMHTRFNAKTLTLNRFAIQADVTSSWGDQVVDSTYDCSQGIHYKVTSTLTGQTRKFIFTATSIADSTLVNTRTIELTNSETISGMDGVFVFAISTRNLKSQYSNFKWTGM